MTGALDWFGAQVGTEALDTLLLTFVEQFPGQSVMRGLETPRQWLAGRRTALPHRAAALEELLLLWTANRNEAFQPFEELFEDKTLAEKTVYRQVTQQLPDYFATRPLIPLPDSKPVSLLDLLRAPAVDSPPPSATSLPSSAGSGNRCWATAWTAFCSWPARFCTKKNWPSGCMFNPPALKPKPARLRQPERLPRAGGRTATSSGLRSPAIPKCRSSAIRPTNTKNSATTRPGCPPRCLSPRAPTCGWRSSANSTAAESPAWMRFPTRNWQLWPRRGLNSLWLIGVWERSRASKTIKQLCGNRDAVASAYSLYDYKIAEDLGGEAAYINLRDRAYHHGVRLASDMVPNHMGIDSPWVVEHPEWFISRQDSPYPAYSFNGPDLSHDGRVEIKIEDHYFEQSDAAVVFRRRDRDTGETRYIYHGNDGTSFPWNDTAQLDYLNPAVREQVIQTILHVARLFPVIRFDAAMTLAKRHFHRLWFPGPGSSGAIPSRAEYSLSQAEFDRAMPHEFWREVVDRVAVEVPGTLLLAEAFWLMEGYFVRTLGMHRVYNSAFMNMMRDEKNAEYRSVIKNTLEFDPDIMKRYVNFMSNPDERTAVDQFGTGDKCFGVAVLMATLPGLPMFGHGQMEGFTEKYGMEYRRPRYDETPDHWLVERHEREIAPLLQRRWLFAESSNFLMYDFYQEGGRVDENVFAFSNRNGGERALVIYNNRFSTTRGTIDFSAAYADKGAGHLRQQRLREGLGLSADSGAVLAFRDSLTGLEYLRRAGQMADQGLTVDLHAYQCHVFLDWRELHSTAEQPWDRLCDQLNGRGVPSLDDALINLELQPVHDALRLALDSGVVRLLADLAEHPRSISDGKDKMLAAERKEFFDLAWRRCDAFLRAAQAAWRSRAAKEGQGEAVQPTSPALLAPIFRGRLAAAMRIPIIEAAFSHPWTVAARRVLPSPSPQFTATAVWGPLLGWCLLELLAESIDAENPERMALDLFDRLRLREPFAQSFSALGFDGEEGWRVAARIKVVLLSEAGIGKDKTQAAEPGPDSDAAVPQAAADAAAEEPVVAADEAEASEEADEAPEPLPERVSLAPSLWLDPDVRWLTGAHEAEGHSYLVREPYEELLWWLLMPSLLRLAGEPVIDRSAIVEMGRFVDEALASAEAAGYRIDALLGSAEQFTLADQEEEGVPKTDEEQIEPSANEPLEA